MSGQYGEPDWANPSAAAAPVENAGTAASGASGWAASGGEDFSGAANANSSQTVARARSTLLEAMFTVCSTNQLAVSQCLILLSASTPSQIMQP